MKPEFIPVKERGEDLIDFPELVRTFSRYKWGIVGLTVLSAILAGLIVYAMQPLYRSTVSLLVESQTPRVATLRDVYDSELPEIEFLGAQVAILRSRDLARRTIERLNLFDHAEFEQIGQRKKPLASVDLRRYLPFLGDADGLDEPMSEQERREAVIDAFMERVTVEPFGRTRVIHVHFDAYSPALAAQVANTLADLFVESGLEARLSATTKATSWLTDKLGEIQNNLQQAEAELQQFREKEQLVNVGSLRGLTEDEVLDYSRRLREAEKRRTELHSTYQMLRQVGNDPQRLRNVSSLLSDSGVQRANDSFLEAQESVKQLEDRYGPRHPQLTSARARLATAEAALTEQLRIASNSIQTQYQMALESERALARQVETSRSQIRALDRKDHEISVLQRNVTTYRELYDTFLTRFKETDVAGSYQAMSARVIDPAVEPREPWSPRKKRVVLLAALGGLVAGILLAILHHLLSEGIGSAEELEHYAQLPVLGVLPLVQGFVGRKANVPKYFLEKSHTPFAEGVRSVAASLRLSEMDQHPHRRIMVTSSVPEEGKSSVSSTLALTLARHERVVLVETDLRKPSLRRLLKLPADLKGLTHVLAGECPLADCLHLHETGSLWVLPAGKVPSNPAEVLGSKALSAVLKELAGMFDRMILDSPPVQATADALVLGRQCDGVLFVVKSDATSRRAVKNSLKQLRFASVPLTGLVVNQVDTRRNRHYADSYNYAYGYYG
jgi:polysaccharide biosynthesis transport protein